MPKTALSLKSIDRRVRALETQKLAKLTLVPNARPELKAGETYSGIILGKNGERDYHLVHISNSKEDMPWQAAQDYAKKCGAETPSLRELALLRTNAREKFDNVAYWSNEQYANASVFAWSQHFVNGNQLNWLKGNEIRGCAVRRVPI